MCECVGVQVGKFKFLVITYVRTMLLSKKHDSTVLVFVHLAEEFCYMHNINSRYKKQGTILQVSLHFEDFGQYTVSWRFPSD